MRLQRREQHDEREPDAGGEEQVEHERRQRHDQQRDDEDDGDREADFGVALGRGARRRPCGRDGGTHATQLSCSGVPRMQATAEDEGEDFGDGEVELRRDQRADARLRAARGRAACSRCTARRSRVAISLMRSATLRWPIARTIGAGALIGSYWSATRVRRVGDDDVGLRHVAEHLPAGDGAGDGADALLHERVAFGLLHLLLDLVAAHLERLLVLPELPEVVGGGEAEVREARRHEQLAPTYVFVTTRKPNGDCCESAIDVVPRGADRAYTDEADDRRA